MVQVFLDGALVKTHVALEQGKRTDRTDYSPEKIAFQMRTPVWCRTQAAEVGDACRTVVNQLLEVNALYQLRAAQGILGLKTKYGDTRLEAACCEGHRGRRSALPDHQGHPDRRHRDRSGARIERGCRSRGIPPRAPETVRLRRPAREPSPCSAIPCSPASSPP